MSHKICGAILVAWWWLGVAVAQSDISSGEIHGKVTDALGAVVPDAKLVVVNSETAVARLLTTDDWGDYRALLLRPGIYAVKVECQGFASKLRTGIQVSLGQIAVVDFQLDLGPTTVVVDVKGDVPLLEPERTQQSSTIDEAYIRQLPIDRRDYLTYSLLVPGVVDSAALADDSDFRVAQTPNSGLSFFGSNGRGNSVTVDGGEANDASGGVRPTLSQEAVQEFQISLGNYSAELGGASGGVINIVSKSGNNSFRGSTYGFFRDYRLDAADPFARNWVEGQLKRIKPPSERQQFGATLGGPLTRNQTFFFVAFEGLARDESNSVSVLTDPSIFQPTLQQEVILSELPPTQAELLRRLLTSPPSSRQLFEANNGVFPFTGSDYKFSIRIDHKLNPRHELMFRSNYSNIDETNPNTRALVGVSRGTKIGSLDSTNLLDWKYFLSPRHINEARFQFNYYNFLVSPNEKFGPELNINGFGFFNRDFTLPSNTILRRYELSDGLSIDAGSHLIKIGGQVLARGTHNESQALFSGRFTFGNLPGGLISPVLASTTINALQAFNLGLPQFYQQGFGDPTISSTDPFYAIYLQDRWKVAPNLTLDLSLCYELDDRRDPLPTDRNNFAPRFGFAWDPWNNRQTTIRGGYGIYYSPIFYFVDWVANALNEINGRRQIAQVLTTLQTAGPANAGNIFRTLRGQGVVTLPSPTQSITPADLKQFGINVIHEGPLPSLSTLFRASDDFVNAYSEQASLGIEQAITPDFTVAVNYLFARTLKIVRARDDNLLAAPVDPVLGIRIWSPPFFKRPLLLQDNVYESTARAFYHGLVLDLRRRFSNHFSLNLNYTLSKAIDEVVDFNSDFQANDQLDLRAERALSSFDQRHKLVVYASLQSPFKSGRNRLSAFLSDFTMTPIVRGNSARPFNLLTGFDLNGDRHSTTDRPVSAGRNTGIGPNYWTVDFRLTRRIRFGDKASLELMAEAFNLFNRLNFRSINNTVGNIPGPFNVHGRRDLSPSQPLGFTSAFDSRRIQLGIRLNF